MPVRESANARGARRARQLETRVASEFDGARRSAGLSFRELARRLSVSADTVARALRGDPAALSIDFTARLAAVLGLQLSLGLHPDGDPVRDAAHLALIRRFVARLPPALRWSAEVAIPSAGDRRSGDGMITGAGFEILVEAETRLHDVQALDRSIAAKRRDLGVGRVILLVADTRHNRRLIATVPELTARFPVGTRAALAALSRGRAPVGDALVIL